MTDALTEEQVEEFRDTFNLFDMQGAGSISTEQLGTVIRSMGMNPTETELKKIIEDIDSENTGKFTFEDILYIIPKAIPPANCDFGIAEHFRMFDRDGNGYVSAAELRYLMTSIGEKLTEDEVEAMVAEGDIDGAGQVDYEEFARVMSQLK